MVKQIISVRRSITDTPFADIKGSEAPMLLLNILKLYDQCFTQEQAFVENFFGKDNSKLLTRITQPAQEKIMKSIESSLGRCQDYRILACCLNQIKLALDELHDDPFLDRVVEALVRLMDAAVEVQAQSILSFPHGSFLLDPLADKLNQAILEYSTLDIPYDRLVDTYEQRLLRGQNEHPNELEQAAVMINCYNHLVQLLPKRVSLSSKLHGYLETFAALLCSQLIANVEGFDVFEALNGKTAVFNGNLTLVISSATDTLKNFILSDEMRYKVCNRFCHRVEVAYEELVQERQLYIDPLQLDTLVPENILKDHLSSLRTFFPCISKQ